MLLSFGMVLLLTQVFLSLVMDCLKSSQTEIIVALVIFYHEISKKSIQIGARKAIMDLRNGTVSGNLNDYMLLQGYSIYFLSI